MAIQSVRITNESLAEAIAIGPSGEFIDKKLLHQARTNYRRIVSKSPEELAKWLALHPCLPLCPAQTEKCFVSSKTDSCAERWIDWLMKEATD